MTCILLCLGHVLWPNDPHVCPIHHMSVNVLCLVQSLQDILSLKSQPAQQELIGSIYIALHGPESFNVKVGMLSILR